MKILLTILLLCPLTVAAQIYGKNDSLLGAYQKATSTNDKLETLNHLVNAYMYSEPGKARQFIEEGLHLSEREKNDWGLNRFLYQKGVYFTNLPQYDSAAAAYDEALAYARKIDDTRAQVRAINGRAVIFQQMGRYDESIRLLNETLPLIDQTNDSLTRAITYSHLANTYKSKGYTKLALENLQKSIRELIPLKADMRLADAYYMMGDLEVDLEHPRVAMDFYQKAAAIYQEQNDHYFLLEVLYSMASAEIKYKNWTAARALLDSTEAGAYRHELDYILGKVAGSKAEIEMAAGNYTTARKLLEKYLTRSLAEGNLMETASARVLFGKLYNRIGRPQEGLPYLNQGLAYYQRENVLTGLVFGYETRTETYRLLERYEQALEDYKAFKYWSDSLTNIRKIRQIEELRIIFDTEQKEAAIARLGLEVDKSNLQKSLFAGGMISAVIISGLLFFGFRQRSKRAKAEYEKKQELTRKELEIRKKELVSQTLHLVNKNTMIQDLKADLAAIKKANTKPNGEISRVIKNLEMENTSDANWEVFKSHFSLVHNDFDQKLKTYAPDISDNEIRLAAFLKMKLSTKEIAALLNVLPVSVNKSKYRLKKKFKNVDTEDFDSFLETI